MVQSVDPPIIFQRYPCFSKHIPWLPLGNFPTPVHQLVRLGDALRLDSLWIKRDDRSGPLGGGNKVRKLEYLLADARGKGYQTLFAVGTADSNHVRATVAYGKAAGFGIHCLLLNQSRTNPLEANVQAIRAQADQIRQVSNRGTLVGFYGYECLKQFFRLHRRQYLVAPGGSSPLSCLGYVNAAFELKAQIEAELLPEPKLIFVASGTCGTMAGLIVGAKLAGLEARIIGVRVVDRIMGNAWSVTRLARHTMRLIETCAELYGGERICAGEIEMWHRDFGRGYAVPTESSLRAVGLMQEHEAIHLETTYTGKALAGLIHYVREHRCENQPILFWNTYGQA